MICTVFIEDTVRARTRSLDRRFCRNEHFCRFFDLLDSAFKTTPIQKVKNHSKIITSDAGSLRICILFWHVRARTRSLDRRFCRNEHFCRFFDLLDSAFKTTPIQKVKNHSKIITSDAGSLRICILFWHGVFNKDGARRFSSFGKFPRKNDQKSAIF